MEKLRHQNGGNWQDFGSFPLKKSHPRGHTTPLNVRLEEGQKIHDGEKTATQVSKEQHVPISTAKAWGTRVTALVGKTNEMTAAGINLGNRHNAKAPTPYIQSIESLLVAELHRHRESGRLQEFVWKEEDVRELALFFAAQHPPPPTLHQQHPNAKPFSASHGWFGKFINRHGLRSFRFFGKGGSVHLDEQHVAVAALQQEIAKIDASPTNTYNADQMGLFIHSLPNVGYVFEDEVKSRRLRGYENMQAKERVTVHLCSDVTGNNRVPTLVIGKAERPRAFAGTTPLPEDIIYTHQKNAWMDLAIMQDWFDHTFVPFATARRATPNSPIILILDNFSGQKQLKVSDPNIHILHIPPNTSPKLQPLDQGAIKQTKSNFKVNKHLYCAHTQLTE